MGNEKKKEPGKTYRSPALTVYGSVKNLTAGGGTHATDNQTTHTKSV